MARKIDLENGKLRIDDKIITIYEKTITKFGTGAKIDAPKEFLGKKVYVMIRDEKLIYTQSRNS
jgi:putative transposon-encoded protein